MQACTASAAAGERHGWHDLFAAWGRNHRREAGGGGVWGPERGALYLNQTKSHVPTPRHVALVGGFLRVPVPYIVLFFNVTSFINPNGNSVVRRCAHRSGPKLGGVVSVLAILSIMQAESTAFRALRER